MHAMPREPASARRRWMAGAAGLAVAACSPVPIPSGRGAADQNAPLFLSDYGLAFTDITVQGTGVRALVDTGSASSLRLSARLAQELQIPLTTVPGAFVQGLDGRAHAVQRGPAASVAIGSLRLGPMDIEVAGSRIEAIAQQVGTVFDAVLGWGLLGRNDLEVDYPARRLRFGGEGMTARPVAIVALPYAEVRRLPVIEGLVAGQAVRLLVDTGAPQCNLDAELALAPAGDLVERMLVLGAWSEAVRWRVKDLGVTRQALGSAATLGNSLLARYRLGFNVRDRMLSLR